MKRIFTLLLALSLILSSVNFANAKELDLADLDITWWEDLGDLEIGMPSNDGLFIVEKKVESEDMVWDEGSEPFLVEKYGVVNKYGKVIIPIEYELVLPFKDDKYYLKKDTKVGLADKMGNIIMDFKYDEMPVFIVKQFFCGISAQVDELLNEELTMVSLGEKTGLIDDDGNEIFPPVYEAILSLGDDIVIALKDEKTYLYNTNGDLIKELKYDDLEPFSKGYVVFSVDDKYGIIDSSGNEVIEAKYDEIGSLNDKGIATAKYGEEIDYINKEAKIVEIKEESKAYEKYGLRVLDKDGKCALASVEGKELTAYKYDKIYIEKDYIKVLIGEEMPDVQNDIVSMFVTDSIEQNFGLLNRKGEEITDIKYKFIDDYFPHDIALAKIEDEYSGQEYDVFIKKDGRPLNDKNYDFATQFDAYGLACVGEGVYYGFINTKGEEIIPLNYYLAEQFTAGLAPVMNEDEKFGYIDRSGDMFIEPIFEQVTGFGFDESVLSDEAIVEYEGKKGLLKHPKPELIAEENKLIKEFEAKMLVDENDDKDGVEAKFTTLKMTLDDKPMDEVEAYLIDGHNYFKLRDIAMLALGSKSQFSVNWDGDKELISIKKSEAYQPLGRELKLSDKSDKKAILSTCKIEVDGKELALEAYLINNENYFQIRDLAELLGFDVEWNNMTRTVEIMMN